MITVQQKIDFSRGRSGRRRMATKVSKSVQTPASRVPRISRLMALAIRFDGLLRSFGHFSRHYRGFARFSRCPVNTQRAGSYR
jgi:hypothetical protein